MFYCKEQIWFVVLKFMGQNKLFLVMAPGSAVGSNIKYNL
jgi:hypothetical protein